MKILHVISSSGMYGAESVIVNLCKWFNAEGHPSSVAAFLNHSNPNFDLYLSCRQQGIESGLIPSKGKLDWGAIRAIRELAFASAVDVVHAHGYKADVCVHLALRGTRFPYLATCHNWLDNDSKSRVYGYIDRWILSAYSRIAAVSEEVEGTLCRSGIRPDRIKLIRNGIDVRPFLLDDHGSGCEQDQHADPVIGFVGRLSWEKGPDVFVRAAKEVVQHNDRARFLLAGDGPELSKLQELARELRISGKIRLLSHVRDVASLYHDFDIMVSSSRREGLPIVILEGMASGLPVIATSVGDVPKVVHDGRTGLLVPSDDPCALSRAILRLLEDPAQRNRLGASARRFVSESFSLERMGREYLELYERVILNNR